MFAGGSEICGLSPLHLDSQGLSRIASDNICLQMADLSNSEFEGMPLNILT